MSKNAFLLDMIDIFYLLPLQLKVPFLSTAPSYYKSSDGVFYKKKDAIK